MKGLYIVQVSDRNSIFTSFRENKKKIIRFNDVPPDQYSSNGSLQQNNYSGFLWANCKFISLSNQESHGCQNAFKPGQHCVAYSNLQLCWNSNAFGAYAPYPISISTPAKDQTFNVESIEALLITNDYSSDTCINGMKNKQVYFTRRIQLHNELQLITLNWTNIDTLAIEPGCQYPPYFELALSQIVFTLP